MATNYSDLYTGLINQNLSTNAKKAYMGPEATHAGEVIKVRAKFDLSEFPTETSTNYVVRVCEVPYLGSIVIDKISAGTTFVEPATAVKLFVSDNGTNGNTDFLSPTIDDGAEVGPFREIKCRYRNAGLYFTATYEGAASLRITPLIVEATIRQTSGREALTEVTQTEAPAS